MPRQPQSRFNLVVIESLFPELLYDPQFMLPLVLLARTDLPLRQGTDSTYNLLQSAFGIIQWSERLAETFHPVQPAPTAEIRALADVSGVCAKAGNP
jgi:hypothetical protein